MLSGESIDPLHVFRFGDDGRMYVHGEEVVLARRPSLDRAEWSNLCARFAGDAEGDFSGEAKLSRNHGTLEFTDYEANMSSGITASVTVGATDLRIGNVQFLVSKNRGALIVSHPPYPISRWTVLWEGDLFPKEGKE